MPTLDHNGIVEMFRENPSLAARILERIFHKQVPYAAARVADSGLDQLIPIEFRADLVLELLDESGKVVFAIVLEVQREKAPRKKYTWAVYWAVSRAERECPAVVVVVALDGEVAAWASERVDLGLGLSSMQPLVVGPTTVPLVTDAEEAVREVELSVLSAMVHGNSAEGLMAVQAAFLALGRLDREHEAVYFQLIWNMLREPMRRALEALAMQQQTAGKAILPAFAQQLIERGKVDGFREGKVEALLRLVARAGIPLTESDRKRIQACADPALLDRWIENILGAKSMADVFA